MCMRNCLVFANLESRHILNPPGPSVHQPRNPKLRQRKSHCRVSRERPEVWGRTEKYIMIREQLGKNNTKAERTFRKKQEVLKFYSYTGIIHRFYRLLMFYPIFQVYFISKSKCLNKCKLYLFMYLFNSTMSVSLFKKAVLHNMILKKYYIFTSKTFPERVAVSE